jgi:electron transfer flavoprotein beta subunit
MRILCIVRRVPDSRAALKVRADGSGIETAGLKYVCDPFDEFGVEQAVRLKENRPAKDVQEVVALGVGGDEVSEVLRHALAMGADRAAFVPAGDVPMHDELALARLLAQGVKRLGAFDLILCGKQAIDNDAGELGAALAECLDLPSVGAVTSLIMSADGTTLSLKRRIEGAEEAVELALPGLVTCEKGLVEPRHPPLPKVMKAKKAPVESVGPVAADAEKASGAKFVRLAPPSARPACRFIEGEPAEKARELVRRLRDEVKVV